MSAGTFITVGFFGLIVAGGIWVAYREVRMYLENVRQAGFYAGEAAEQSRQRARRREENQRVSQRLRQLVDDSIEERQALEEARFWGELAQSDLRDTYAAVVALESYNPKDWWLK